LRVQARRDIGDDLQEAEEYFELVRKIIAENGREANKDSAMQRGEEA
jgi:hypothetical protein